MAEQNDNKLDAFDDDNGEKLNIKKNLPNNNGNPAVSYTAKNGLLSSNVAKLFGYFFLIASVALFIVGVAVNVWATLAGGICMLGALTCIGISMYLDWGQSKEINRLATFKEPSCSVANPKSTQKNVSMFAGEKLNKIPIYKTNDYNNSKGRNF